jgi:hypothetical protein
MSSRFLGVFAARAVFEHTPYPPTPFHPRQGGKGSLTATLDVVAPGALLRSHGRHCFFSPRSQTYGRRDLGSVARANGGHVAARVRGTGIGVRDGNCVLMRTSGERAAPRSVRASPSAFTTTAGSPTLAPISAVQPHAPNSVFGAQPPNRLLAPLSALARVERGWGIGGVFKANRKCTTSGDTKWI